MEHHPYEHWYPGQILHIEEHGHLLQRYLFWTTSGYIGLGSSLVLPRDQVVILMGTLHLLHKAKESDEAGQDVYKITGDCYLYGWMYGTEKSDCDDFGTDSSPKVRINPVSGEPLSRRHSVIA